MKFPGYKTIFLVVLFSFFLCTAVQAADPPRVAIGANTTFSTFNEHYAEFQNPTGLPDVAPDHRQLVSNGSDLFALVSAWPGFGGVGFASLGEAYIWDAGGLTFDQVRDVPVVIRVNMEYRIETNNYLNGSANSGIEIIPVIYQQGPGEPQIGVTWYDYIGIPTHDSGVREGRDEIVFTANASGTPLTVGNVGNYVGIAVEAGAKTFDYGNSPNLAAATVYVHNISVEFPDPPPRISSVKPSRHAHGGKAFAFTLNGMNFQQGNSTPRVFLWQKSPAQNITATNVLVPSTTKVTGKFKIPKSARPGSYNVTIVNPDGWPGMRQNGFKIVT